MPELRRITAFMTESAPVKQPGVLFTPSNMSRVGTEKSWESEKYLQIVVDALHSCCCHVVTWHAIFQY